MLLPVSRPRTAPRRRALAATTLGTALLLAGCGGGQGTAGTADGPLKEHPGLDYAFVASEEMAFAALKDGQLSTTVSNSAADTGEP